MALEKLDLKITGMTCAHCEKFVTKAIMELDGISSLMVDYRSAFASMTIDNSLVSGGQIAALVNETGIYHAEIIPQ